MQILVDRSFSIDDVVFTEKGGATLIDPNQQARIEASWQDVLAKNPKAFAGATVRLDGFQFSDDGARLLLDVVSSDYKQGMVLGWLGVAMIPITSDGFVALQAPVASIAATVGGGIRVPGCTPPHPRFFHHIVQEMLEEFGVTVGFSQLKVLGLVQVSPPAAKYHHTLVVMVSLKETIGELKVSWEKAEDKWEGEVLPFQLTPNNVIQVMFCERDKYGPVTPLSLYLVARARFGDFGVSVH
ncbi:MAG: hypothetical protein AAB849_00775 [Patescibacteria group bacterium]